MIRHHLTDTLLMGYSAGQLPEAFNLIVAAHVSMCDDCRARLYGMEAVGGVLLDDVEEVATAEDSLAATLARIREAPTQPKPERALSGVFPSAVRDYVGGDVDTVRWRSVGGGVQQAILPTSRSASARLLRIPGGVAVPDHGHRGTELTLVLQGAFSDGDGRFGPGDIEIADASVQHTPVAEAGPDCICLAVTDAPLRFTSLIPRLLQPFLRI